VRADTKKKKAHDALPEEKKRVHRRLLEAGGKGKEILVL